jgi:hypothetical protein
MSDRKYRQRGYQDDDRDREKPRQAPRSREDQPPREMRAPNFPGFQETIRCSQCGQVVSPPIVGDARCPKCQVALHSCAQCANFDPGARFECMQPVPVRIMPKDAPNTCASYDPRVRVERKTGSQEAPSARKAFDDLFKF